MRIYRTYAQGFYFKDKVKFIDKVFNQENLDLITELDDIKKYMIKGINLEEIDYDYIKACYTEEEFEVDKKQFKKLIKKAKKVRKNTERYKKKINKFYQKFKRLESR